MQRCSTCNNNYSKRGFLSHSRRCQKQQEDGQVHYSPPRSIRAVRAVDRIDPYASGIDGLFSGFGALITCISLLKIVTCVFLIFMGIYLIGQIVDSATKFSANLTMSGAMMAPVNVATNAVGDYGRDLVDRLRDAKDKEMEFVAQEA